MIRRSQRQEALHEREKQERTCFVRAAAAHRAALAHMEVDAYLAQVRNIKERRAVVRLNTVERF